MIVLAAAAVYFMAFVSLLRLSPRLRAMGSRWSGSRDTTVGVLLVAVVCWPSVLLYALGGFAPALERLALSLEV